MRKPCSFPSKKQFFAGLLAVLCMAGALSGCKIEFPDDVADDAPSATGGVSLPGETPASQTDGNSDSSSSSTAPQTPASASATSSPSGGKPSGGKAPGASSDNSPASSPTASAAAPKPVEPADAEVDEKKPLTCTVSITCKTILDNMDLFNKDKLGVLPKDGVIYAQRTVTFYEGESVFDVLARETKKNRIHMEHTNNPLYNSEYIEGINNIYEKDCGEGSGWMYKVNGWFPNYGCSRYQIKPGDKIEWLYTCDLGHDLGGGLNKQLFGKDISR